MPIHAKLSSRQSVANIVNRRQVQGISFDIANEINPAIPLSFNQRNAILNGGSMGPPLYALVSII